MAPWLTGLSPVLSQGRTMPLTFPYPIFKLFNQNSCHRQNSGNPLSYHAFQCTTLAQFWPLLILAAGLPMKKAAPDH
jgi:hypothetical protein